ncbi:MAG: glycoside hydrolase family 30 protein [Chitinophagaceae bacterium]
MKKIWIASLAGLLFACSDQKKEEQKTTAGPSSASYSLDGKKVNVYTTADSTSYRLSLTDSSLQFAEFGQPMETQVCVFVDPTKTFQTMLGIGGAITDASAETFAKLPKEKQEEILKAYYDPVNGIGYTLARTNIHSCDFSSGSYTYVKEGDKELTSFSIDHDKQFRIPLIKQAISQAGGKLTLYASPWSPPAFMKDSTHMLFGGKLKPEFYDSWAHYFAKFIKAYEKEGIPVWGVTVQNEPMARQTWESCIYTAEEEANFLKSSLGPTLEKEGLGDKKIIIWDHNRDLIYQRVSTTLRDPEVAKYVWGIGYHWYETWTGGDMQFENLKRVAETFPDKHLIFTEGCAESFNPARMNAWALGERYGMSMINDFNAGTVGWTDWNVLLDEMGGPNHVKNFCFAPVHGDTKTGQVYYTNSYYYIGHFSRFIRPGAKRIISSSNRTDLLTTAFLNEDGKVAVVVMNKGGKTIPYRLWIAGKAVEIKSLPHSIATLVL